MLATSGVKTIAPCFIFLFVLHMILVKIELCILPDFVISLAAYISLYVQGEWEVQL